MAHATALAQPGIDGARVAFAIEDVAHVPGGGLASPHARLRALLSPPDRSHRLFVVDQDGRVLIMKGNELSSSPFLDLRVARTKYLLSNGPEQGLTSIAFHPDFARAGRPGYGKFYTFSTEAPGFGVVTFSQRSGIPSPEHDDVVAEWSIDTANPSRADVASRREVMRIAHPLDDHVGGHLAFNPTAMAGDPDYGKLYISVGDGGNTVHAWREVDKFRTAQDKRQPLGKILRIDPIAKGGQAYSIPLDNPFVRDAAALPEIWAYGFRNPQCFSWDRQGNHSMLIADIGQKQLEEIDLGHPGANYGWSEREGPRIVDHQDEYHKGRMASGGEFTDPALVYGRAVGIAITGGYVYRKDAIAELRGLYIFGDIANGRVFATEVSALRNGRQATFYELPFQYQGTQQSLLQIVKSTRVDLRFGIDDIGRIYVLSKQDGMIRRIERSVPAKEAIVPVKQPTRP